MATTPSDAEVLAALQRSGNAATYVVKNWLNMIAGRERFTTAQVRRRLKDMEVRGLVARAQSGYAVMLCWKAA